MLETHHVRQEAGDNGWDWFAKNPDLPVCPLAWAVEISGMSERQLRNAIDRKTITVGRQTPNRRWAFSYRDIFQLQVIAALTGKVAMPISAAIIVAERLAPVFVGFVENGRKWGKAVIDGAEYRPTFVLVYFENEDPVLLWDTDVGLLDGSGNPVADFDFGQTFIRICPTKLIGDLVTYHVYREREATGMVEASEARPLTGGWGGDG